jgi:cyanate permease
METISSLIGFIGILMLVSLPVLAFGGLIALAIPRLSRYFETTQK